MIARIVKFNPDGTYEFETEYGVFSGLWSNNTAPIINRKYSVELDSEHIFTMNDVIQQNSNAFTLNHWQITGILEEFDGEVLTIRLGESLVELYGEKTSKFNNLIGKYITLKISNLKVYNDDLV